MSSAKRTSLSHRYPWRLEVPALILLSTAMLVVGLLLPLMKVEKFILWKNEYSVLTGIKGLLQENQFFLAAVLFFFSIVFPVVKLLSLLLLWWWPLSEHQRNSLLHWLEVLGRWSMLDVFAVSILIVLVKLGPLANVKPQPGLYFFCLAIITSMLVTMYVKWLAKRKS